MGFLDRLANFLGLRKAEASVIVVGLDNSGKSTLLNHFKPEEEKSPDIVPTVGFNVEKFKSESKSKLNYYTMKLPPCLITLFHLFWPKLTNAMLRSRL